MFQTNLWCYLWDLVDEGIDPVLDRLQGEAGATGVSVATCYHSVDQLRPHPGISPRTFRSAGGAQFQPASDRYAATRIRLSVPQVLAVLGAMVAMTLIDFFLLRGAKKTGEMHWGKLPAISQYVLIFIAVTFTWLMGLMGYLRSGLRMHWHVYGIVRDNSVDAFTPTLGFATQIVSITVLIFCVLIGFVFWISGLSGKKNWEPSVKVADS